MFRRKKTPNTIQNLLKDTWIDEEKGIITNLPMRIAWEHRVKEATFVWIMLHSRRFSASLPLTTATAGEAKSARNGLSALMESFALSMIGSRATITPSQREECLSRKPRWSVGGSHRISFRLVQGVIDSYLATGTLPKVVRLEGDIWES